MNSIEKINIDKAKQLMNYYKKNRWTSKQKLAEQLISWQYFFDSKSIIGVRISLPYCYRKSTVEDVLNDLGYKLDYFSTSPQIDLYGVMHGRDTNFSFSISEAK